MKTMIAAQIKPGDLVLTLQDYAAASFNPERGYGIALCIGVDKEAHKLLRHPDEPFAHLSIRTVRLTFLEEKTRIRSCWVRPQKEYKVP